MSSLGIVWKPRNPLPQAIQIVQDYLNTGVPILYQQATQLDTFMSLLQNVSTRKENL